jgi:hypothetical protein
MDDRFEFGRTHGSFDNWDLCGGNAISASTIANAEKIIADYQVTNKKIEVYYFGSGVIELTWLTVHGELTVEVGLEQYTVYLVDYKTSPLREIFSSTRKF